MLGFYTSQASIILGVSAVNSSSVYVDNMSFVPYVFNAGNMSSYLFSAVNASIVVLDDISIVLGTVESPVLSNLLVTTSTYFYQFGGLIANMNSTTLNISDIQYDVKQTFMIYYMSYSGLLIGRTNQTKNNVILQRICLSSAIKSFTSVYVFGVIGSFEGTLWY